MKTFFKLVFIFFLVHFNAESQTFINTLPADARADILWYCDYEDQSFLKWTGTGGGIFNTDEDNVYYGIVQDTVYSGNYSSKATIYNAVTPGESKAVRFMRWTDKPWEEGGVYFPDEAYYSVFMYFPEVYHPEKPEDNNPLGDGGWWNIFQFKSANNTGSKPLAGPDLYSEGGKMYVGCVTRDYPNDDSDQFTWEYFFQPNPLEIKPRQWVHFEAYYKKSDQYKGEIKYWQDGVLIYHKQGVRTVLPPGGNSVWGIGNYTDYITTDNSAGTATIYFDDAIVSKRRISQYLTNIPTKVDSESSLDNTLLLSFLSGFSTLHYSLATRENKIHTITISDISGRVLINQSLNQPEGNIDITNLSSGVYIFSINGISEKFYKLK